MYLNNKDLFRITTGTSPSVSVFYGKGIEPDFVKTLSNYEFDKLFFVADSKPYFLHGTHLVREIRQAGFQVELMKLDISEQEKTFETLEKICNEAIQRGVTRDSILIGFGGGTLTNIAGLAASLLYRGICYVEVPTTFLCQTDSSFSNKQAINGPEGKNQFGSFYAPLFIWSDFQYTETEEMRYWNSAIVEGMKNALISNASLLSIFDSPRFVQRSQTQFLFKIITSSKKKILKTDPTEQNQAAILEYGHTFGHAIEFLLPESVSHGEAVAVGMCMAAEAAFLCGRLKQSAVNLHYHLLIPYFPTKVLSLFTTTFPEKMYRRILSDNKKSKDGIPFILLSSIGSCTDNGNTAEVYLDRHMILKSIENFFHKLSRGFIDSKE